MVKPRCLVWGDDPAPWHPLGAIRPALRSILETEFECVFSIAEKLSSSDLDGFRLVVNCIDRWESEVDGGTVENLFAHVSRGGHLISLHGGISLARNPAALPLVGGRFIGHPARCDLTFSPTAAGKTFFADGEGIDVKFGFILDEEPYRVSEESGITRDVVLEYRHEGQVWPAAWVVTSAIPGNPGLRLWLLPGHDAGVHENAGWGHILHRAIVRCAG